MILTELQLKIQEWAEKTLSRNCIIAYTVSSEQVLCGLLMNEITTVFDYYDARKDTGYVDIIGSPMTYGRLCYLCSQNNVDGGLVDTLENEFRKNPDMLQRTVLDWDVELQEKVLLFLQSLPKGKYEK